MSRVINDSSSRSGTGRGVGKQADPDAAGALLPGTIPRGAFQTVRWGRDDQIDHLGRAVANEARRVSSSMVSWAPIRLISSSGSAVGSSGLSRDLIPTGLCSTTAPRSHRRSTDVQAVSAGRDDDDWCGRGRGRRRRGRVLAVPHEWSSKAVLMLARPGAGSLLERMSLRVSPCAGANPAT